MLSIWHLTIRIVWKLAIENLRDWLFYCIGLALGYMIYLLGAFNLVYFWLAELFVTYLCGIHNGSPLVSQGLDKVCQWPLIDKRWWSSAKKHVTYYYSAFLPDFVDSWHAGWALLVTGRPYLLHKSEHPLGCTVMLALFPVLQQITSWLYEWRKPGRLNKKSALLVSCWFFISDGHLPTVLDMNT